MNISVIIPVHNSEKYINTCVKSLQEQTYTNLEIILINDGSNEACSQMLEELSLQDSRIKLYELPERRGVGAARNFGVSKATGTFVYFLDSDDYLPEQTLDLLVKHIKDAPLIRGRMYTTGFSTSFAIVLAGINQVRTYDVDKYNLIKNKSAQNFLIRRDYIIKNDLTFSEDVEIYSDLAFMIPALIGVDQFQYVREALYFRRRRNDPILDPALSQRDVKEKIKDFLYVYQMMKDEYQDDLARAFLDKQLLNFYRKDIVNYFKQTSTIDQFFEALSTSIGKLDDVTIKDYFFKKEIQVLASGNFERYKRTIKRHNFLRDFKKGRKSKNKFNHFIYQRFFSKLKKNNKLVIFESFQGGSYSDNPKYIYEYMHDNNMNYKYVWSVKKQQEIPGKHKQVKRLSLRYYYTLARAKYWVSNSRLPNYIEKNNDTVYLQTWHGTPLKKLAGDMKDVHMPGTNSAKYKTNFYNETQKWDYLIAPNAYSKEIFQRAFWFDKTSLDVGYPRNDVLYTGNTSENIERLKTKMELPLDKKVILYAPTWRDDEYYSKGKYRFNLKLNLATLQEKLGDEYVVVLRMHYFISSQLDVSEYEGFVYDYSTYNDIGELYLISDLLITDYSSVFFDYANLKRPILFYTYDLEKYRDSLRGFYIDMDTEVPGPLLTTTEEVIHSIQNINELSKDYQERYETFYNRFCDWEDGQAAKKTIEHVFK